MVRLSPRATSRRGGPVGAMDRHRAPGVPLADGGAITVAHHAELQFDKVKQWKRVRAQCRILGPDAG